MIRNHFAVNYSAKQIRFSFVFFILKLGTLENIEKLEQLRSMEHGYRIHVGITDQPTIGIDTPEDIAAFESALTD